MIEADDGHLDIGDRCVRTLSLTCLSQVSGAGPTERVLVGEFVVSLVHVHSSSVNLLFGGRKESRHDMRRALQLTFHGHCSTQVLTLTKRERRGDLPPLTAAGF